MSPYPYQEETRRLVEKLDELDREIAAIKVQRAQVAKALVDREMQEAKLNMKKLDLS